MKRFLENLKVWIVFLAGGIGGVSSAVAANGDSQSHAVDITTFNTAYSVKLVTSAEGTGWSTGCYWYRVKINHSSTDHANYTIKMTGRSSADMVMHDPEPADESLFIMPFATEHDNGDFYAYIEDDDLGWETAPYAYFYIRITGKVNDMATLTVVKGRLEYPEGDAENPYQLVAPADSTTTKTITPVDTSVYGQITLPAGVRVRFETTGASATDSPRISFPDSCAVTEVSAAGAYDKAYSVVASATGTYRVALGMSINAVRAKRSLTFAYALDTKRPLSEHVITGELSPTTENRVAFQPGKMMVAGYDDEIIDECLFSVPVQAGHIYLLKTAGATAPLKAMAYDASGASVSAQTVSAGGNVNLQWAATATGIWYAGVCENVDNPSYAEISVWVEDVSDRLASVTFDPSPGTLPDEQKARVVAIGSPLGELPVPTSSSSDRTYAGYWLDSAGARYTADTVVTGSLTLTPKWSSVIAAALDSDLDFTNDANLPWEVMTGDGSNSTSCVTSYRTLKKNTTTLQASVTGAGVLTFSYKWNCSGCSDVFSLVIDGKTITLPWAGDWTTMSQTISGEGVHTVKWTFNRSSKSNDGSHRVLLDQVHFSVPTLPFTISWASGCGVAAVQYAIGSGAFLSAVNGGRIDVENGAKVSVSAQASDWHVITTDLSQPFDPAKTSALTVAAKDVSGPSVVTDEMTPADLGIVSGTFANEPAGSVELAKVVAWAKTQGVSVAQVNAMTFTKDPQTDLEKAYLLDCAVCDIDAESVKFVIESIEIVGGVPVIAPATGDPYGNGKVELRSSTSPGGAYTVDAKSGGRLFYKAYLVK